MEECVKPQYQQEEMVARGRVRVGGSGGQIQHEELEKSSRGTRGMQVVINNCAINWMILLCTLCNCFKSQCQIMGHLKHPVSLYTFDSCRIVVHDLQRLA